MPVNIHYTLFSGLKNNFVLTFYHFPYVFISVLGMQDCTYNTFCEPYFQRVSWPLAYREAISWRMV